MLQIALLLLTCGLSRYMWSLNTSVARVVISFTILGIIFYIGIIVAGTFSYECPFQTPASTALRHLRNSATTKNLLVGVSPVNVILLIYTARRYIPKFLANLSLPSAISLIYATWMDAWQGLVSASHRAYYIAQNPSSLKASLVRIMSGICNSCRRARRQVTILLRWTCRTIGNTKRRLVQGIRRLRRALLLPITTADMLHGPHITPNGPGLRVPVRNLEALRKRNADNVRCVSWVLWNITDPEAIDSAIRLAGSIRWFDGNSDHNPPYDLIVSTFGACFDSTKQLYPGMRDRAYFSARAILQINTGAKLRSRDHASKYPIPTVSSGPYRHTDPDFYHIIRMLQFNSGPDRPTIDFPRGGTNTPAHLLWMSNLFVELTRIGPNPILRPHEPHLSVAATDHQAMIANTLIMWYMFLGGDVEEETFWAIDKSYVLVSNTGSPSLIIVSGSDSLEVTLSQLSTKLVHAIAGGHCLRHLTYLMEFLEAWEKRPTSLTSMAYQWCCTISEAAARLGKGKIPISGEAHRQLQERLLREQQSLRLNTSQHEDPLIDDRDLYSPTFENGFSIVVPGRDPTRLDNASPRARSQRQVTILLDCADLLCMTLQVVFRPTGPGHDQPAARLGYTPYNDNMFEAIFSSDEDEVIADAVCAWIADRDVTPPGSFARYFTKRVENEKTFSKRLNWASTRSIEHIWRRELKTSGLETVRLLNRLEVDVDDGVDKHEWRRLLISTIRSTTGQESLSSHHWQSLGKLVSDSNLFTGFVSRDVEVMKSLEGAEDWERLEVWTWILWTSLGFFTRTTSDSMRDIKQTNLKLLLCRPSAIPRFEDLVGKLPSSSDNDALRQICERARSAQLPSQSPPSQQVAVFTPQHLSILMPPFILGDLFTLSHSFPFVLQQMILSEIIGHIRHTGQLGCILSSISYIYRAVTCVSEGFETS